MAGDPVTPDATPIEGVIARILAAGTGVAVTLLAVGVGLMLVHGVSPLADSYPGFRPDRLPGDIAGLRPEPFLWLGLIVLVATPIVRVVGELLGLAARGERVMVLVAAAILGVIALSIATALVLEA